MIVAAAFNKAKNRIWVKCSCGHYDHWAQSIRNDYHLIKITNCEQCHQPDIVIPEDMMVMNQPMMMSDIIEYAVGIKIAESVRLEFEAELNTASYYTKSTRR